ncbi:MAG TPA: T9SS type A sorting domain-containing protein, partial [Candidatus Kapabacteria bacterium]|nr:T9SS type A sorting domain-containing protein [Candidatus Kapabacteria bacterium]
PYTFRVWNGQTLQELPAYATYLVGPEAYEISGFSMLATLVTNVAVSQNIQLNTGWNMISGYVVPNDPSVVSLFEDFVGNLKIMKNSNAQMYVPAYSINTIVNWNNADGYLVNMLGNEVLTLTGEQIVPETTPLNLNTGWNLSAYYRDNPMSPFTALASINPYVVLVKNNAGGIYSPIYGINTIGNMVPGQGYSFYMNLSAPLTYPANSARKAIAGEDVTPLAKHLIPQVNNTGNNATLLLSVNVSNGNEIGVYNSNNELIGSGAVYNGVAAVNIWGDNDITANLDGAKANELLTVKLYNSNSNTLNDISLINIQEITNALEQDALYYNSNAIYVAKATVQNETALVMSITNIPNPVSSSTKFEFSLVNDDNAEILVYNVRGEEIARLANGFYNAGTYSVSFDASNLTSGSYNVVLRSGNKSVSTIMMITK